MPLTKESVILGINDAKIFPIITDDSAALTYGAALDVPGITNIAVSPSFLSKDLRGDEQVLDEFTKLDFIDWKIENSIMSLDVLAVLLGGEVKSEGTTPNQSQTYKLKGSHKPKYFKLEGKSDYADVGDVHVVLYKCKASSLEYTFAGEDYVKVSAGGKAIATKKTGEIKDLTFNETAKDIVPEVAPAALTVVAFPADLATGVSTAVELTWTFNNELHPASVNAGTVVVANADGSVVEGEIILDATKKVVTFAPKSALDTGDLYIAIATTGIADIYGQRLDDNCVTSFTIA